jgi:hypothetical protein
VKKLVLSVLLITGLVATNVTANTEETGSDIEVTEQIDRKTYCSK